MNAKKILIASLSVAMLSTPFLMKSQNVMAKEQDKKVVQVAKLSNTLSESQVKSLAAQWAKTTSYVQRGGDYKSGEYKTFQLKGTTYRYLAGDIDTKKELFSLVGKTLTKKEADKWFKKSGIIQYNGKLAQPEADGGSLLQWEKATVEYLKTNKHKTMFYRLVIPVGDSGVKEMRIVELQKERSVWKVSKVPYLDLNIPGNINPAYVFFKYLLVDHKVAQDQLLNVNLKAEDFKKGIKKLEIQDLKEVARNKTQVEFAVKINVQLENGYKGLLKNGQNEMYFLIQQTNEMEFKIVGMGSHQSIIK